MPHTKVTENYERWEVQKIVDERIDVKLSAYNKELREFIATQFIIKLQKLETMWSIGKFVVTAVALLVVGTLYQIFLAVASSSGVGK